MPCKGLSRSIGGDFNHDPFVTLFWGTRWSCSIVLAASCCVPSADGIIWGHVFAPLTSHYWANVPATVGPLKQAGWKNWKTATCPVKKGINWLYIYIYIFFFFFSSSDLNSRGVDSLLFSCQLCDFYSNTILLNQTPPPCCICSLFGLILLLSAFVIFKWIWLLFIFCACFNNTLWLFSYFWM